MDEFDDPIFMSTYGYPQIDYMGKNDEGEPVLRIVYGWFMPVNEAEDPACYVEDYIHTDGTVHYYLNWICGGGNIHFDFWTPLKEYVKPHYVGDGYSSIAERFNIPDNIQLNEICIGDCHGIPHTPS